MLVHPRTCRFRARTLYITHALACSQKRVLCRARQHALVAFLEHLSKDASALLESPRAAKLCHLPRREDKDLVVVHDSPQAMSYREERHPRPLARGPPTP